MTILSLPSGVRNPGKWTFRGVGVSQTMTSPLSGATQTAELSPAKWRASATFTTVPESDWRLWEAFLSQCRGQAGRFYVGPYHASKPRGLAGGSPIVDGSSQTGNTLLARGCTASQSPWLRIGDYFHYVSPSWQQMHRVVSDVASDSSGHASLTIEPAIRESPAAGAAIITSSPQDIAGRAPAALPAASQPGLGPLQ